MSQAGLVSLDAESVYGGVGYLFAIATSQWNLSPLAAIIASMLDLKHSTGLPIPVAPDPLRELAPRAYDAAWKLFRDPEDRVVAPNQTELMVGALQAGGVAVGSL
jgi:hypothetical protein